MPSSRRYAIRRSVDVGAQILEELEVAELTDGTLPRCHREWKPFNEDSVALVCVEEREIFEGTSTR